MQKPTITAINMLILRQTDIAAAVKFYQSLGLRLKFHLKDSWAELTLGLMRIGLCPTGQPTGYKTGIVFQVDNLRAFYTIHKDDIPFLTEPKEAPHGIMASIQDPGGNILDLYQPTPERVAELAKNTSARPKPCCQKDQNSDETSPTQQCCKLGKPDASA